MEIAPITLQLLVEPQSELLPMFGRYTQHRGDDLDRERRGEIGDDVEFRGVKRVSEFRDRVANHRLESRDRTWCEHLVDQFAHHVVIRRIHHDDHRRLRRIRLGQIHIQRDAPGRRVGCEILQRGLDVFVSGQRPKAVLSVVVDGRFVAKATVRVERRVEEVIGKRVEFDCFRRCNRLRHAITPFPAL
jgi:hypothetical protein